MRDDPANDMPRKGSTWNMGVSRRNLLLGGGLLAVSAAAFARTPQSRVKPLPKGALEKLIPTTIGMWQFKTSSGLVLPPPDPMSDKLYSEILTRFYTAPNMPPLALLIAYSNVQNGLLQLHRPETCYPASGYQLGNTEISELQIAPERRIPVRSFSADGVSHAERVLYWTRVGDDIPTSWTTQRLAVAKANLRTDIPDGILVRMSVISGQTREQANAVMGDFTRALLSSVPPTTRKLLVGSV